MSITYRQIISEPTSSTRHNLTTHIWLIYNVVANIFSTIDHMVDQVKTKNKMKFEGVRRFLRLSTSTDRGLYSHDCARQASETKT